MSDQQDKQQDKPAQDEKSAKRPAYEKCWDMPFGGTSPEKHVSHIVAHIIVGFVGFVFKILFRYRVDNRESLDAFADKSGVVIIANHTSFLDVVFIYLSVRPKLWPRMIARSTLFEGKPYIFAWILAHLGVFPIKRDTADRAAIKRASGMLKNDEVVCIMPEGTRRGKGSKTPEIHGGAALIARMGHAPILPMTVRDAENVKRKGERIRFPKITCEFGDPILVSDFDFLPKQDKLDGCMWYAMRECFALSQRVAPSEVDMKALFPDGKDYTEVFEEHQVVHHTSVELVKEIDKKKARAAERKARSSQDASGDQPSDN